MKGKLGWSYNNASSLKIHANMVLVPKTSQNTLIRINIAIFPFRYDFQNENNIWLTCFENFKFVKTNLSKIFYANVN